VTDLTSIADAEKWLTLAKAPPYRRTRHGPPRYPAGFLRLKFYFAPGAGDKNAELADLFLDPDEDGLHQNKIGSTELLHEISKLAGPYGSIIRKANCCVGTGGQIPRSAARTARAAARSI
jgi:hypothetical protein